MNRKYSKMHKHEKKIRRMKRVQNQRKYGQKFQKIKIQDEKMFQDDILQKREILNEI